MELTKELAEFYGILMGDGCLSRYIYRDKVKCEIRIDGNALTDREYYQHIKILINKLLDKDVTIRYRKDCNGIFITFMDKEFSDFLHDALGFPYGKKNNNLLRVPELFLRDQDFLNSFLRGFFDTDGCLYFTKNNSKTRSYPIIELSTHNSSLVNQLKEILDKRGFSTLICHFGDSVKLHGRQNVLKWMAEIGSKNIDKYSKFIHWRMFGFCPRIDELPLLKRLEKINEPQEI